MISNGLEGLPEQQYQDMVYNRIMGMLKVAAYLGYERGILGAFGCGAFRNDAHVVSDLFDKAMKEFRYDGMQLQDLWWIDTTGIMTIKELYVRMLGSKAPGYDTYGLFSQKNCKDKKNGRNARDI